MSAPVPQRVVLTVYQESVLLTGFEPPCSLRELIEWIEEQISDYKQLISPGTPAQRQRLFVAIVSRLIRPDLFNHPQGPYFGAVVYSKICEAFGYTCKLDALLDLRCNAGQWYRWVFDPSNTAEPVQKALDLAVAAQFDNLGRRMQIEMVLEGDNYLDPERLANMRDEPGRLFALATRSNVDTVALQHAVYQLCGDHPVGDFARDAEALDPARAGAGDADTIIDIYEADHDAFDDDDDDDA